MALPEIDLIDVILLSAVGVLFIIQLIYYLTVYNQIRRLSNPKRRNKIEYREELPALSVIICARNESYNLRKFLPSILEQDYPEYEVIVINDSSSDESEELLSALEKEYKHLYHSFTPDGLRGISHKKLAITLGIKASKHDWLVFTEANCRAESKNWLRLMARNFTNGTDIVLGYSGYGHSKGWFNKQVSFDNLFLAMRFLGFAIRRKAYMGIGRNMAYRKELFYKEKGFSAHLNLRRGDDDLFINQVTTGKNTRVETAKEAVIRMDPVEYRKDWREEKVSYMATSQYYKGPQRLLLGFETSSRLLFYASVIATIVYGIIGFDWIVAPAALLLWLIRYVVQAVTINKTAQALDEPRRYYLTLPIFDLLQPLQSMVFKMYRARRGKADLK